MLLCGGSAMAQVHTTYLWHMQQPIYWPEQSPSNPNHYQTAWESHQLKFSGGNTYSDGLVTVSDVLMLLTLFGESCP